MKMHITFPLFFSVILLTTMHTNAQNKIGCISIQELVTAMPEYKTAGTEMGDYQNALAQQSADYQKEITVKDSVFSADSLTWNPTMKEIKRKELNALYLKMLNFNQQGQQLLQQKEQSLIAPIQKKAIEITQTVAKEAGYGFVLNKDQLIAYPVADDLLPLVAKRLNLHIGDTPGIKPSPAPAKKGSK